MKQIARLGVIGASVITSGCLALSGAVSADSITNTGPGSSNIIMSKLSSSSRTTNNNNVSINTSNYQTAQTGTANVSGNTSDSPGMCNDGYQSDWSSWNPDSWQRSGRTFSDWWTSMMGQMNQNYWSGGHNNSMDGGSNWDSWNPSVWCQSGSTYGNWLQKFNSYMTSNCIYWQQNWHSTSDHTTVRPAVYTQPQYQQPATYHASYPTNNNCGNTASGSGYGGGASTGSATNENNTQAQVSITNSTPAPNYTQQETAYHPHMGNSISDTGPHSFNLISSKTDSNVQVSNTNNVTMSNTNTQTAVSGNATVSGNTHSGSATTGSASNTNSTDFEVAITNN